MSKHRSNITILLGNEPKYFRSFFGDSAEVIYEAESLMKKVIESYIKENKITDPEEAKKIVSNFTYEIEEEDYPQLFILYYETTDKKKDFKGMYSTIEEVEEAIEEKAKALAYETLVVTDPLDIFGEYKWDYDVDLRSLKYKHMERFGIYEIPVLSEIHPIPFKEVKEWK